MSHLRKKIIEEIREELKKNQNEALIMKRLYREGYTTKTIREYLKIAQFE